MKKQILSIFGVGIITFSAIFMNSNTVLAGLNDGLIAFYPFNGNANDESGNDNHGTVYGAALTYDRFGNANSAYYFDGINDKIIVADSPSLRFGTDSFSLLMWLNATTFRGQDNHCYVRPIIKDHYPATWWGIDITKFGEGLISLDMQDSNSVFGQAISTDPIKTHHWYHIAVIVDRKKFEAKFYINSTLAGIRDLSDDLNGNLDITGAPIAIGGDFNPFKGLIDDVYIYNRALSEFEIRQLYGNPVADAGPDQAVFDQITLDANESYNPDNRITLYQWQLNHRENSTYNRTAQGIVTTVSDLQPGYYDVTLTIRYDGGLESSDKMVFSAIGCKGDFNSDEDIDGSDLAEFAVDFGCINCPACQ